MDYGRGLDWERLELDAEKAVLVSSVAVVLFGLVVGGSISLEGGTVVQAILSPISVSSNWAGVAGDISGFQDDTAMPIDYFFVDDSRTGSVHTIDLEGQNDGSHFFAALPFYTDSFRSSSLSSVSFSDLEADGLFSEEDFPVFYPNGSTYDSVNDNPEKTFEEASEIRLMDETYDSVKTVLNDGVEYHMLSYDTGSGVQPVFITAVDEYSSCYDGNPCNYQFMLPEIEDDYSFYMLSENDPLEINIWIDGEDTTVFPYSGRPYNLTVETLAIFDGYSPADTEIRVTEKEGNNIFTPAISSEYSSEAQLVTETVDGEVSMMYSPTDYSSPDDYNLTLDVYSDIEAYQSVELTVENDNIEFTDQGPAEKGFEDLENDYKRGVDRLRPVANCMFAEVSRENAYRLEVTGNESYTVTRGIPYVVDVSGEASYFSLSEQDSHLVMSPGREHDTVHLASSGFYENDREVVFTPTLGSSEDENLSIGLVNSQGDLLGETKLSVKDSTCGSVDDGELVEAPELTEFKKRVNAIRPVLNSLFVAGS